MPLLRLIYKLLSVPVGVANKNARWVLHGVLLAFFPLTAQAQAPYSIETTGASCVVERADASSTTWRVDMLGTATSQSAGAFLSAASDINDGFYFPTQVTFCDQWTGIVGNFLKYLSAFGGPFVRGFLAAVILLAGRATFLPPPRGLPAPPVPKRSSRTPRR